MANGRQDEIGNTVNQPTQAAARSRYNTIHVLRRPPMDLFISYTHTDRPIAAAIAGEFAKLAIEVWWDHDLMAGEDYRRRITEILAHTSAVIVLWSRRSIASQWVLAEATTASERRALVPLSMDGERPPIDFRSLHTIQLDGWCPGDPLPQEVVRAVAGLLGRSLSYSTQ
ncbi:MAG TPA: toll/interleukin-1 receptor domain-containing protein, partial [Stellaceae bacterium]|nr:toll/interleukin-1 receptor domain-containing protein [Stellaceae bacterium]